MDTLWDGQGWETALTVTLWRTGRGEQGYSQSVALALANARGLPAEGRTFSRSEKANPRPPGSKSHGLIQLFS